MTLGILDRRPQKIEALQRIIAADRGDYVDDATYELGRTYIASGATTTVRRCCRSSSRKIPIRPSLRRRSPIWDWLTSIWVSRSCRAAATSASSSRRPVRPRRATPCRASARFTWPTAMIDGYFAYAEKAGVECDTSVMARDSLSFAAARRIYLSGDTAAAEKSLRSYLRNYPKGYYTDDALFYLSDCHLKAKQTDAAIETLSELAARPTNQYSARTLGTLSKLTSEAGRHAEAAKAYRALYDVVQTADERPPLRRVTSARWRPEATMRRRWPPPRR